MPDSPNNSIALDAWPNNQGAAAQSPFATLNTFAEAQNRLNANRQFQQEFAARQKAGQIIAASPTLEDSFTAMTKDPQVAPWAGQIINDYRQGMVALTQYQGEQQKQAESGLGTFLKMIPTVLADPSQWGAVKNAALSTMSPYARKAIEPAIDGLGRSLIDGLPTDNPEAAKMLLGKRIAGLAIAGGLTKDGVQGILGTPTSVNTGGTTYFGLTPPAQEGGGFVPKNSIGMTLAPQLASMPGGVSVPVGGGTGMGTNALGGGYAPPPSPGAGGSAPSGTRSGPIAGGGSAGGSAGTGGGAAGGSAAPSGTTPGQGPAGLAGDGTPLIPQGYSMEAPYEGTGIGGLRVKSKDQLDNSANLNAQFGSKELDAFNASQAGMGALRNMNNSFNTLVKAGGFLMPGPTGDLRARFAGLVNTLGQIIDVKSLPFSPEAVATSEELFKDTKRMGAQITNLFFGAGHEAAETINSMTSSVPGIENTFLGSKLLIGGIHAMLQRNIDERNFKLAWQNQNQGDLTGAAEAFNSLHPADQYAQSVLDQLGLNAGGFKDKAAVVNAYKSGLLTQKEAGDVLESQFGMKWKNKPQE